MVSCFVRVYSDTTHLPHCVLDGVYLGTSRILHFAYGFLQYLGKQKNDIHCGVVFGVDVAVIIALTIHIVGLFKLLDFVLLGCALSNCYCVVVATAHTQKVVQKH